MNEKMRRIDGLGDFFEKSAEAVNDGTSQIGVDSPVIRAVVDTLCGTKAERDYMHTVVLERLGARGAALLQGFIEWILNDGLVDQEEEKLRLHSSAGFLAYLHRDSDMARFHADQSPGDSLSALVMDAVELMDTLPPEGMLTELVAGETRKSVVRLIEAESI